MQHYPPITPHCPHCPHLPLLSHSCDTRYDTRGIDHWVISITRADERTPLIVEVTLLHLTRVRRMYWLVYAAAARLRLGPVCTQHREDRFVRVIVRVHRGRPHERLWHRGAGKVAEPLRSRLKELVALAAGGSARGDVCVVDLDLGHALLRRRDGGVAVRVEGVHTVEERHLAVHVGGQRKHAQRVLLPIARLLLHALRLRASFEDAGVEVEVSGAVVLERRVDLGEHRRPEGAARRSQGTEVIRHVFSRGDGQ